MTNRNESREIEAREKQALETEGTRPGHVFRPDVDILEREDAFESRYDLIGCYSHQCYSGVFVERYTPIVHVPEQTVKDGGRPRERTVAFGPPSPRFGLFAQHSTLGCVRAQ